MFYFSVNYPFVYVWASLMTGKLKKSEEYLKSHNWC